MKSVPSVWFSAVLSDFALAEWLAVRHCFQCRHRGALHEIASQLLSRTSWKNLVYRLILHRGASRCRRAQLCLCQNDVTFKVVKNKYLIVLSETPNKDMALTLFSNCIGPLHCCETEIRPRP